MNAPKRREENQTSVAISLNRDVYDALRRVFLLPRGACSP